jgi:hypothetical protein
LYLQGLWIKDQCSAQDHVEGVLAHHLLQLFGKTICDLPVALPTEMLAILVSNADLIWFQILYASSTSASVM